MVIMPALGEWVVIHAEWLLALDRICRLNRHRMSICMEGHESNVAMHGGTRSPCGGMCGSQQDLPRLTMYVFLLLHYCRRKGVIVQWI